MKKMKKNIKWIILLIVCVIFLLLLQDALEIEIKNFDKTFHKYLVEYFRNDILTIIMKCITWFANPLTVIMATLIALTLVKERKQKLRLLFNLIFVTVLNMLLKGIIQRERPIGYRLIEESGYSFPSAHSMVSLAFYGYFIYLIWKSNRIRSKKIFYTILLSLLIFAIGISRIYLGVHYASDVFAGLCLSLGYLIIYTTILEKIDMKKGEVVCGLEKKIM